MSRMTFVLLMKYIGDLFVLDSDSQPRMILPPWGHLALSGDIIIFHS
jgi:hypothetical protein